MAQGTRRRFALLGAGLLFCTGLVVGCHDYDKKPTTLPAKAQPIANSTVKPNQGYGFQTTQTRPQQSNPYAGGNSYSGGGTAGNFGSINSPTTSGATGMGDSRLMQSSASGVVPGIAPQGQGYSGQSSASQSYPGSGTMGVPSGVGPLPPNAPGPGYSGYQGAAMPGLGSPPRQ